MRIYNPWAPGKVNTFIMSPGAEHPEVTDWHTRTLIDGSFKMVPTTFCVRFVRGQADVERTLGEWMIKKGHAFKRPQPAMSGVHSDGRPPVTDYIENELRAAAALTGR